ncbi:DUF6463 family protein [uncultured Maribacter sp.]|uniref:DUF6463 family protein n=1 Tax=uncultured Maribacter sp. TaxID=431308 RepID=UPI00261B109C|nr:DUF6463 family protein [uncultured Maribacter sp.]
MKINNGKILIFLGISHFLLGISPLAFGKQFNVFYSKFFFRISEGLLEFPFFNGQMNYEYFAAFWFVYFGLLLIPFGMAINHIEKTNNYIPRHLLYTYLFVVLIGVYMIPLSGMTFLMLPQAIYMLIRRNKQKES